jgi:nucleotide-binding universal stress UspA family protein
MLEPIADPRTETPVLYPEDLVGAEPVTLRHLFVPSDLSEASDGAFGHARLLARRFASHLTLYHAVPVVRPDEEVAPEVDQEIWRRAAGAAREFLSHRAETVPVGCGVQVERATSPADAIVSFIERHRPDLTVMATHGRRGLARVLLGSVTERVVRTARRPVLCVREPDHGVALPYRRVLVPTDFSQTSRSAFPMAACLARGFGAEVLALHAAPRPGLDSLSGVPARMEAEVPDESALAAFLLPDCTGLRVIPRVALGFPWQVIVETARAEKADVIVMSTHGHDSVADRMLGSHAERVLRHAPCPVLITW